MQSTKDALLTEHLRYTPLSLIDDIINSINTVIYRAVEATESGLLTAPPSVLGFAPQNLSSSEPERQPGEKSTADAAAIEAREEIENGVHALETLLEATVDKTFDRFEIYALRNILRVPEEVERWIRLEHYENLTLPVPSTSPTPESILALRRTLQESQKLNIALTATHARNAALISQLKTLLSTSSSPTTVPKQESSIPSSSDHPMQEHTTTRLPSLTFLTSPPTSLPSSIAGTGTAPLTTSAQFTASQLPALRALVNELRPKIAEMRVKTRQLSSSAAASAENRDNGNSSWEERRKYVDDVAERVAAEFGTRGDSEKEEGVGIGRRREGEEVADLEKIVGGLRRGEGKEEVDRMEE